MPPRAPVVHRLVRRRHPDRPARAGSGSGSRRARRERQREFWRARYAEDPRFFGAGASEFARRCLPILRSDPEAVEVLELGCGYGRDTRFLAAHGLHLRGVDLAGVGPTALGTRGGRCELIEADGIDYLEGLTPGRLDAVFSNMLLNMDFTESEHRRLIAAVHRALRPGGLHCYSARATSDPWYGRGRKVGRDTFEPSAGAPPIHFFSRAYCDRLASGRFEPVLREEHAEGGDAFPIRLWYVIDRRR